MTKGKDLLEKIIEDWLEPIFYVIGLTIFFANLVTTPRVAGILLAFGIVVTMGAHLLRFIVRKLFKKSEKKSYYSSGGP